MIDLNYYESRCLYLLHKLGPMARIEMTSYDDGPAIPNDMSMPAMDRLMELGFVEHDCLIPSKWQITDAGRNHLFSIGGITPDEVTEAPITQPVEEPEKIGATEIAKQVKLTRFDAVHFLQNTRDVSAYLAEFLQDDPDGPGVTVDLLRSVIDDAVRALDSIHAGQTMVKILREQHAQLNAESAEGLHQ